MTASVLSFSLDLLLWHWLHVGLGVPETSCIRRRLCWWCGQGWRGWVLQPNALGLILPPGFLQRPGDLVWCVLQNHCRPQPVWRRGYAASAWFLMLDWCWDDVWMPRLQLKLLQAEGFFSTPLVSSSLWWPCQVFWDQKGSSSVMVRNCYKTTGCGK